MSVERYIATRVAQGLTTAQAVAEVEALKRQVFNPRTANAIPGSPLP